MTTNFGDTTMLGDVLTKLRHTDALTDEQIATAARVGESTANRWRNGEQEPRVSQFISLLEHLPQSIADRLVVAMFAGTPYAFTRVDAVDYRELDRNGDGKVDIADGQLAAAESGEYASRLVTVLISAMADGRVTEQDLLDIDVALSEATQSMGIDRAIAGVIHAERKHAR